jgi:hypothetical protein
MLINHIQLAIHLSPPVVTFCLTIFSFGFESHHDQTAAMLGTMQALVDHKYGQI